MSFMLRSKSSAPGFLLHFMLQHEVQHELQHKTARFEKYRFDSYR
jgi:hypothetical protein